MDIFGDYNKPEPSKNKNYCVVCRALTDDLLKNTICGCMHCQPHLGKPLFKFIEGDFIQIPSRIKKIGKKSLANYIKKMNSLLEQTDNEEQVQLIQNSIDLAIALEKQKQNLKQDLVEAIEEKDIPRMDAIKAELKKIVEQCLQISKEA